MVAVSSTPPGPGFTVERHVGRVIEARVYALRTAADVDAYGASLRATMLHAPHPRIFICADHRAVHIYPPEAAARLIDMFTGLNPRIERAGLLVSPTNAILVMQIERIVRQASDDRRQVFTGAAAWSSFLGESMTDDEKQRLRTFQLTPPIPQPSITPVPPAPPSGRPGTPRG